MNNYSYKKANINDIEQRLKKVEERLGLVPVEGDRGSSLMALRNPKKITLPEISRKGKVKNGQQSVALIVGYWEKIEGKSISPKEIQKSWLLGKFNGKYNPIFLSRAIKEGWVRDREDRTYDLTQTGEEFFSKFIS